MLRPFCTQCCRPRPCKGRLCVEAVAGWKLNVQKEPIEARVLSAILKVSSVPYSSYVPLPRTGLHAVHAQIKQVWLIAVLLLMSRASPAMRLAIAVTCALLSMATLPRRLWKAQLARLGLLALLIFVFTATGSDGVPPVAQSRAPAPSLTGLAGGLRPAKPYNYVIFHFWFVRITRRSVALAVSAASLMFTAFQSASLCLTTTPAEEMALALQRFVAPLKLLRVPVREIGLTLLLSLRFMELVFEEVRNLSLGLASRGVNWAGLGPFGGAQVFLQLGGRMFENLMHRSENIALAMTARGFTGPEAHHVHMTRAEPSSWLANSVATALLAGLAAAVYTFR
ncbi:hypothetical protein WJX72_003857 [[Myrmecia] bisecta]|uniref:Cobalt transport protein n=1 Tax=[Myrmecia] bisecta TaxID=41462 RepID=A0AAW1Q3X3_9CHLO